MKDVYLIIATNLDDIYYYLTEKKDDVDFIIKVLECNCENININKYSDAIYTEILNEEKDIEEIIMSSFYDFKKLQDYLKNNNLEIKETYECTML